MACKNNGGFRRRRQKTPLHKIWEGSLKYHIYSTSTVTIKKWGCRAKFVRCSCSAPRITPLREVSAKNFFWRFWGYVKLNSANTHSFPSALRFDRFWVNHLDTFNERMMQTSIIYNKCSDSLTASFAAVCFIRFDGWKVKVAEYQGPAKRASARLAGGESEHL